MIETTIKTVKSTTKMKIHGIAPVVTLTHCQKTKDLVYDSSIISVLRA